MKRPPAKAAYHYVERGGFMNNTIKTRLQVFLAKIAGKDVDVSTLTPPVAASLEEKLMLDIADRIDDIEGGTLPNVSSTDNGNVLTVVEGSWAKAAPSGGGSDIFIADFYWGDDSYECNHTFAEIAEAYETGKTLIGTCNRQYMSISVVGVYQSSGLLRVEFTFWEPHFEVANAFAKSVISITEDAITETYIGYQAFTPIE